MKPEFQSITKQILSNHNYRPDLPLNSNLFQVSEYLNAISDDSNSAFYRRYLNHLQYFTGVYKLEGDNEFNKIAHQLLRHAIEFGKVALTKFNGKLLPIAISELEYDIYGEIKKITGYPIRMNYGYTSNLNLIKCKPSETVVLRQNYLALPFIYFWKQPLYTIEHLLQAAITGSVASIKKFKRRFMNNSSLISNIEQLSYTDPKTPYISVISNPKGYGIDDEQSIISANDAEFTTSNSSTEHLWTNLKEYMEFEYFQLGRRVNTNKKAERNISREIDTEVINFEILDEEFKRYLELFKQECKDKLKIDIEIQNIVLNGMINETPETNNTISGENTNPNSVITPIKK